MDYVLDYMKKNDIPVTRENYLDLAYLGNPPELDAESESELPKLGAASEEENERPDSDAGNEETGDVGPSVGENLARK